MRRRFGDRRDASRRQHDERLRKPGGLRAAGEPAQIPRRDRAEVGVGGRRRSTLVLAELRRDLARSDHVGVGVAPPELRRHGSLVRRVAEREEEAHGDRLRLAERGQRREVERLELAVRPDPPADAVTPLERDERLGVRRARPVEVRARLPAQVQQVLEALVRDERRPRAAPLEQRVRRDGRPVGEAIDGAGVRPDRAGRGENGVLLPPRRRHLRRPQPPVLEQYGVRERPADVDSEDGYVAPRAPRARARRRRRRRADSPSRTPAVRDLTEAARDRSRVSSRRVRSSGGGVIPVTARRPRRPDKACGTARVAATNGERRIRVEAVGDAVRVLEVHVLADARTELRDRRRRAVRGGRARPRG